jgi:hypothetical protein
MNRSHRAPTLALWLRWAALLALVSALRPACGGSGAAPTGSLEGTFLGSPTPVQGVRVTVDNNPLWSATTSSEGYFKIDGVPPGPHGVSVDGSVVFDGAGTRLPAKADLHLSGVQFVAGQVIQLAPRPLFIPALAPGVQFTGTPTGLGTATYTFPADQRIGNDSLGVYLDFTAGTVVTFPDPNKTTISISGVPIQETPMPLPAGVAAVRVVSVQPAGARFNPPPRVTFPNSNGLPAGKTGVELWRFDHAVGAWAMFGVGTVTADGSSVVSDLPNLTNGTPIAGWHGSTRPPFRTAPCVCGRVTDSLGNGIPGIQVVTVNARTAVTDANGNYSIDGVPIPADGFSVVVTASPINFNTGGYLANSSPPTLDPGSGAIGMPDIILAVNPVPPDTTAPTVTGVSPLAGATGVATNANIQVTFSENLSSGSVSGSSLTLTGPGGPVTGVVGLNGAVATFMPSAALLGSTTYTVTATTVVSDLFGNHLAANFTSTFTTAAVISPSTASVVVTPASPPNIIQGAAQQFTAQVLDSTLTPIPGAVVTWSSSNSSIVGVTPTGLATGYAVGGPVTIKADAGGGVFGTATLTIDPPPVATVTVTPATGTVPVGSNVQFTAVAMDSGSVPINGIPFTWTSSDPVNAPIGVNSGLVAATGAAASVTITATAGGISGTATLTIVASSSIATVTVTPPTTTGVPGDTRQFTAVAKDGSSTVISGVTFAWTSTSTSAATVNSLGVATAVAGGAADITATAGGQSGFGTFTVQTIATISVSPTPATIQIAGTQAFTAVAKDAGTNPISNVTFTWTSSNPAVATVSGVGVATGVAAGTTTITATAGGVNGTATLNVSSSPPGNLIVTLRGGAKETDPRAGVRVLRHNPVTGAFIEEITTDGAGVANFGNIGTARTTITVVDSDTSTFQSMTTFSNIATGSLTLGRFGSRQLSPLSTFAVNLTSAPGGSTNAEISTGKYDDDKGGTNSNTTVTAGTAGFTNVTASQTQTNGLFGVLGSTVDASGNLTGWGFVGGLDPATVNLTSLADIPVNNAVVSIPYSVDLLVTSDSPGVRVGGLVYGFAGKSSTPSLTGSLKTGSVPGADRWLFTLGTDETTSAAGVGIKRVYTSLPATVTDTMPALGITNIVHDRPTQTISWTQTGADWPSVKLSVPGIGFQVGLKTYEWQVLQDSALTSVTFPQVPANLAAGIPSGTDAVSSSVEVHGLDNILNYDDFFVKMTAAGGNLSATLLNGSKQIEARRGDGVINLGVSFPGSGTAQTVTISVAPTVGTAGPITVAGNYPLQFPGGTTVVLTASQTGGTGIQWNGNGQIGGGGSTFTTTIQSQNQNGVTVTFN